MAAQHFFGVERETAGFFRCRRRGGDMAICVLMGMVESDSEGQCPGG